MMRRDFSQQALAGIIVFVVIGLTLAGAIFLAKADDTQTGDARSEARLISATPPIVSGSATLTPTSPLLQQPTQEPATQLSTATGNNPTSGPPSPAPTIEEACGPPSGWVPYTVRAGENLFRVGLRFGQNVNAMVEANCLSSTSVNAGQTLFVPPITPIAPTATPLGAVPTSDSGNGTPAPNTNCTDPGAQITSPARGETYADIIFFFGTAQTNDFSFYKLEVRPAGGGEFITFDGAEAPVTADFLGQVAAYAFPPGKYEFRLAVVDTNSNIVGECLINAVLEGGPTATPTS